MCFYLCTSCFFLGSELMSLYRQLSRDIERLRGWRRSQTDTHELYVHTAAQLHLRRKQLIKQLLLIYPIEKVKRFFSILFNIY